MKTAKLIIDGKEIEVQISDKQVKELTASEKVTGFERADNYLYIDSEGDVEVGHDKDDRSSNHHYAVANYYTNGKLAQWCRRSDKLAHKMRRWAAEHNSKPISLNGDEIRWYITWSDNIKSAEVNFCFFPIRHQDVYFETQGIAEAAIKEFGEEIKWLTENRPKWF